MPITGSDLALMYAQSGVARSGATRSNYTSMRPYVSIDGVHYATARAISARRVLPGLTIQQEIDDAPDTCTFKMKGFQPSVRSEVVVNLGSKDNADRLFGGVIMTVDSEYVEYRENFLYTVQATDFTWHLTRKLVTKRYTSESATDIALDLMTFAPSDFTTVGVESGLETLDEFTVTNVTIIDALRRLAKRIGGYVDVSPLKDLRFGVSEQSGTQPTLLWTTNSSYRNVKDTDDLGQVVTRVYVEGGGVNALTSVDAGDTILPVQNVVWYNEGGGVVVCGPQRITYLGTRAIEGGALVGPGGSPASPLSAERIAGSGITAGEHSYAFTFVTGAGESLPSPLTSFSTAVLSTPSAPSVDQTVTSYGTVAYTAGNTVDRKLTYSTNAADYDHESAASGVTTVTAVAPPAALAGVMTANGDRVSFAHSSDTTVQRVRMWRQVNGGGYFLVADLPNVPGATADFVDSGFATTVPFPAGATSTYAQASLSGIAVGPSGTTSRKVYRTEAGGTQLKLLTTLADNTTLVYTDSTADGSLGANVPTSDTSGLSLGVGQVIAGATELPLTGTGAFDSDGGWAVIGNGQQVIRYTGLSGNSLTGIPASGNGAIVATIAYNSTATPAPCLFGIEASGTGSIRYDITGGDPVNLLVQVDTIDGQTAVIGTSDVDDGVIEEYVTDNRLSEEEARLRGEAILALRGEVPDHFTWESRDINTRAGRSVQRQLTVGGLTQTYRIQSVTISNFHPALAPTFSATASDQRFTFEDMLRQLHKTAQRTSGNDN